MNVKCYYDVKTNTIIQVVSILYNRFVLNSDSSPLNMFQEFDSLCRD